MSVPRPAPALARSTRRTRVRWIAAAAVVALTAVAFGARRRSDAPQPPVPDAPSALLTVEADGLVYRYHAVHGRESLFDLADPEPRPDRSRERPEDTARLRARLLSSSGVTSLDDLRAPFRSQIEALRRLGYL